MPSTTGGHLARRYFEEVVGPIIRARRPGLAFAAGRLGSGSDVLGVDDATSQDHDWGLRLAVLLDRADDAAGVSELLEAELPETFAGRPVRFPTSWDPTTTHKVDVMATDDFVTNRLGLDLADLEDPHAWLWLTGQSVLEIVAGPVFADDTGRLTEVRELLRWYPTDVWRYVLACSWHRLSQELPFVGRTADAGDGLGSRIIAARLARDVMYLAFLVERTWPPYPKWFGTMFARLPVSDRVAPALTAALEASDWRAREDGLVAAIEAVADAQRTTEIALPEEIVVPFWDRAYRTVHEGLAATQIAAISDPRIAALPVGVGSIEQRVDNVDLLAHPDRRARLWAAQRDQW